MNNTKTLAIVAIFMAATLVVGTFAATATTQTALAYQQKKNRGGSQENSRDGNTVTVQKCKQDATESGFDNSLEQECQNVICTHPGENATCTQEGVVTPPTPPTPPKTCEECLAAFLNDAQIQRLLASAGTTTPAQFCEKAAASDKNSEAGFSEFLNSIGVSPDNIKQLIACLKQAGIPFNP